MTRKAEQATRKTASTTQLIESFVREAALTDPKVATTYKERERHVKKVEAYVDEIARRDRLSTLVPLLDESDAWIAYYTVYQLSQFEETKDCAMVTLDRIASADRDDIASRFAKITRNMVRFDHPSGEFRPPTEIERAFLHVVTLGYPAAELQIETCLIAEWEGLYLAVRVLDGPALAQSNESLGPRPGPTVAINRHDVQALESSFWVNDAGTIVSVVVDVHGTGSVPDSMSYFLDAARCAPERLRYPTNTS